MLYQVRRFRVLTAFRVGLVGGLLLGGLGGLLFLPLLFIYDLIQQLLLFDFFPSVNTVVLRSNLFGWAVFYSVGMAIIGGVIGSIGGGAIISLLAYLYNLTTRYTGGLMVELETRGKVKGKISESMVDGDAWYDREEQD